MKPQLHRHNKVGIASVVAIGFVILTGAALFGEPDLWGDAGSTAVGSTAGVSQVDATASELARIHVSFRPSEGVDALKATLSSEDAIEIAKDGPFSAEGASYEAFLGLYSDLDYGSRVEPRLAYAVHIVDIRFQPSGADGVPAQPPENTEAVSFVDATNGGQLPAYSSK